MMQTRLIVPDGLTRTDDGFTIAIRLPWYRTLPLSVIDMPVVKIDDRPIDPASITLEVNGRVFDSATLAHATDEWWYVLDPGRLHVTGQTISVGALHAITVDVSFAPPYIPEITLFCGATRTMAVAAEASS